MVGTALQDVVMVARVYGRFVPTSQERDRWESIAATLDEEEWGGRGALGSAGNEKALELESPSTCDGDSRGGTRTHDPALRARCSQSVTARCTLTASTASAPTPATASAIVQSEL